ncbi:MAG: hypothetical protein Kow00120_11120 [Anaerolineae bacterium]
MLHDLEPEDRPGGAPGRRLTLYDLVALFFLGLSVLVVVWVALVMYAPYGWYNPFPPPSPTPQVVVLPYQSPTPDPSTGTPTPTETPVPPSATPVTPTPLPTLEPFFARTTATPALSPTPEITPTVTNTPSAYPFTLEGEAVAYGPNYNSAACAWQSIAGRVTGLDNRPVEEALYVEIRGEGVDELVPTGSQPAFGPSGFELSLGDTPRRGQYVVRLVGQSGEPLSDEIVVETIDRCEQNVALVNFVQNR